MHLKRCIDYVEKFNFSFINKSNIYVGKIKLITGINRDYLKMLKDCSSFRGDYTSACQTVVAKEDAILIRIDKNYFIDIDSIKSASDCERINELLISKSFDNNMFLRHSTKDPYVGELFLSDMKTYTDLEQTVIDIARLKLINTQK